MNRLTALSLITFLVLAPALLVSSEAACHYTFKGKKMKQGYEGCNTSKKFYSQFPDKSTCDKIRSACLHASSKLGGGGTYGSCVCEDSAGGSGAGDTGSSAGGGSASDQIIEKFSERAADRIVKGKTGSGASDIVKGGLLGGLAKGLESGNLFGAKRQQGPSQAEIEAERAREAEAAQRAEERREALRRQQEEAVRLQAEQEARDKAAFEAKKRDLVTEMKSDDEGGETASGDGLSASPDSGGTGFKWDEEEPKKKMVTRKVIVGSRRAPEAPRRTRGDFQPNRPEQKIQGSQYSYYTQEEVSVPQAGKGAGQGQPAGAGPSGPGQGQAPGKSDAKVQKGTDFFGTGVADPKPQDLEGPDEAAKAGGASLPKAAAPSRPLRVSASPTGPEDTGAMVTSLPPATHAVGGRIRSQTPPSEPETRFALYHDLEQLRTKTLEQASARLSADKLGRCKLDRIHTRYPARGSSSAADYLSQLDGFRTRTQGWIGLCRGGETETCAALFISVSNTCRGPTVDGFENCLGTAFRSYNSCLVENSP